MASVSGRNGSTTLIRQRPLQGIQTKGWAISRRLLRFNQIEQPLFFQGFGLDRAHLFALKRPASGYGEDLHGYPLGSFVSSPSTPQAIGGA